MGWYLPCLSSCSSCSSFLIAASEVLGTFCFGMAESGGSDLIPIDSMELLPTFIGFFSGNFSIPSLLSTGLLCLLCLSSSRSSQTALGDLSGAGCCVICRGFSIWNASPMAPGL
ncbi:hypothetical protein AMTR_s00071p00196740 [Amborella trichopoda]|uniref:Secreted protein n=1 Tax=Amborella trichopoda TaxID=13333 RepID=U5DF42_AMBTC|nr:hypothetical protein AMTR_s00071p00196740 [Amborella trichopoda]